MHSPATATSLSHARSLRCLLNPLHPLTNLWANRQLVVHLVRRDVAQRYRGSIGGLIWSVLLPIVLLGTYTFVFSEIFKARFDDTAGAQGSRFDYALMLYCGILLYTIFQETIGAAPSLMLGNASYVKKVVFPLEVLPCVKLLAALVNALIGYGVLLIACVVAYGGVSSTIWLFPLVLAPMLAFTLGVAWFVASLGVFLRDIGQVVTLALTVLFFLTPIFYPIERLPPEFQVIMRLNPLTTFVQDARVTFVRGEWPDWSNLLLATVLSWIVLQAGYAWFMKTKRGFADVI